MYIDITYDICRYMYLYVATYLNDCWYVIAHPFLFRTTVFILNGVIECLGKGIMYII